MGWLPSWGKKAAAFGLSYSRDFKPDETGYSVKDDAKKVLEVFAALVQDTSLKSVLQPDGSWKTFCNIGLYRGYADPRLKGWDKLLPRNADGSPFMANPLIEWLKKSADWRLGDGLAAWNHANEGRPTIGAEEAALHGHVLEIMPSELMAFSGSLNIKVPYGANIGAHPILNPDGSVLHARENGIVPTSQAFPVALGDCLHFLYCGDAL